MTNGTIPAILTLLRAMGAWLRHPQLQQPIGLRAGRRELAMLAALELAVLLLLVMPLVQGWAWAFALPGPESFEQLPKGLLVPVAVLAAPVSEELLFRGWLTGRVRALWLLGCALAFGALLYGSTAGLAPLAVGAGLLVLLIAAPLGWFLLRKRGVPAWFARAFPAIFYLVAALFALMHLTNYRDITPLLLPMVLPQAWIGLVLGYARMRIGLPAAILIHMLSNGVVLALSAVAG